MINKGYVYLLLEVDQLGNESHKIGISKNEPTKRLNQLKTGNSNVISLLNYYESYEYKTIEKWLHTRFSTKKTLADNEWFKLNDSDVLGFIELCKKLEETIILLKNQNTFFNNE